MARSMAVSESVATCVAESREKSEGLQPAEHALRGTRARVSECEAACLVTQASTAAVNHDADLADAVDAHLVRSPRVENFVHHLRAARRCSAQSGGSA